ncbi:MAG TPA: DeoR family transcriptional regulator [Candidatus Paceibacterota bacterium]
MDTKDNSSAGFNDPINWKSLGFFSAEDYLVYVFKKTEKITAALYLVSGLLKDEEPMKWELRDRGMDLLSSSFTASSSMPGDKNVVIQSLFSAALETMSLLNVARISNLISDMNHKLLVSEIDNIVSMLRDRLVQNAQNAGYILSESFFRTPNLFASGFKPDTRSGERSDRPQNTQNPAQNPAQNKGTARVSAETAAKKNDRQERILAVLKDQSNLTVKDFAKVITDVSEKTIQRELLDLVQKGVIKREGERRWSRYSLK